MKDVLNKVLEKINLKKKVLEPRLFLFKFQSSSQFIISMAVGYTEKEAQLKVAHRIKEDHPKNNFERLGKVENPYTLKEVLEMFDEFSEEGDILKQLSK